MDPLGIQKTAQSVEAQIPGIEAFIDAQLAKLQTTIETSLGATLADLTAERTEAVNQLTDSLHGVLDRLNGTAIVLGATGFTLKIPERKTNT